MLSRHIETTELKQPVSGIPQNQHGYSQALGGEQQRLNMHDCLGFLCNKENIFQHPPEREREIISTIYSSLQLLYDHADKPWYAVAS